MPTSVKPISDTQFLADFENKTLPEEYFDHKGHLRLAWLYLSMHDVETAIDRVCCGIQAYAMSLGATEKFHLTLTTAMVHIVASRMAASKASNWQKFLQENNDLVVNARAVLSHYYSDSRLFSEQARTVLAVPDIKPIAGWAQP